jgi:hypothetical protein
MSTRILTDLAADDPLVMDANWRFNNLDRQKIDDQILGIQQLLVQGLIRERAGRYYDLDADSDAVSPGQAVCLASSASGTVTLVTSAALTDAAAIVGIVVTATAPGGKVFVVDGGILPPSITSLATGDPGPVGVNTTTGYVERSDVDTILIGTVDNAGWLLVYSHDAGGSGGSTPTGTGVRKVAAGVEDAAASLVLNADVDAAAAIAGSKISPDFGAQDVKTTGAFYVAGKTWEVDGGGQMRWGNTVAPAGYVFHDGGNFGWYESSAYQFFVDTTSFKVKSPIKGSATPYGVHAQAAVSMSDANHTAASSEYECGILLVTGTFTADRTLTLPAPASHATAYFKMIRNKCTGANLVISTGAGATVTLAPSTSAVVICDSAIGVEEAVV